MSDMQDNNVNANAGGVEENPGDQGQERKYTDADVDKIVARKIAVEREKATKKHDTELEQRERDVLRRELTMEARDKLIEANLPRNLSDLMDYSSKEAFEASLIRLSECSKKLLSLSCPDMLHVIQIRDYVATRSRKLSRRQHDKVI